MPFSYDRLAGSTNFAATIRIIDSTDGTPELGVVYNSAGIDLWYQREGAAKVNITEVTLAALTTAWTSGGFLHRSDGYYRLDVPDAALAAGAAGVLIGGAVTGMVVIGCYVTLVAYNPFEPVRLGLTGLANAVPGAAGGLLIAGSNAATTVNVTGTITGNLTGSVGSVTGAVGSVTGAVASVTALGATAKADVNAEVLDVLNVDAYTEPAQGAPPVSASLATKINWLYKFLRNRTTQDATTLKIFADDATTVDHKATVSDNGTTFDRGEVASGP